MSNGGCVLLVRHGEAAARWGESADPGLSPLGQEQARDAARELQAMVGNATPLLLSSPLLRARETALPLAEALGLETVVDERFREIPSPAPLADRQTWLRAFMRGQWSAQSADLHAWRGGILSALDELPRSEPIVIFTHFLVINTIVGAFDCRDDTLVFWPDNASVTVLERQGDQLRVEARGRQMQTIVN